MNVKGEIKGDHLVLTIDLSAKVGIPMIATTRYDGSRPPIPIDRDQYEGAVGYSW